MSRCDIVLFSKEVSKKKLKEYHGKNNVPDMPAVNG